jgi:hypothetical protein
LKKYRHLFLAITLIFSTAGLISCSSSNSGGDGVASSTSSVPILSRLNHPTTVSRGQTYVFSANYCDSEGDIEIIHCQDSCKSGRSSCHISSNGCRTSETSGTIDIVYSVPADAAPGTHHIKIWAEDRGHHTCSKSGHKGHKCDHNCDRCGNCNSSGHHISNVLECDIEVI